MSKPLSAKCLVRRWPRPFYPCWASALFFQLPCGSSVFPLQLRLCQPEEKGKFTPKSLLRRGRAAELSSELFFPNTDNRNDNSNGCADQKQMALLVRRKEGLSTCLFVWFFFFLSVCPSRLGCGVQRMVSTSLRLPKAEVLMSLTL